MTMRCRNGQEHTHETVAQAKRCWLGNQTTSGQVATLAQPVAVDKLANMIPVAKPVQVATGRYAVTLPGEDKIRFFQVKRGHSRTFLDEQASDAVYPVRGRQRVALVLATIAADPDALARYGRELGVCGRCGRTLTDEESRAAGIGPICRGK